MPSAPNYPLAAAALTAYAALVYLRGHLGWQHLALVALAWVFLSRRDGPSRWARDWWPMVLFWLGYDALRLVSDRLLARVAVRGPFLLEARLFRSPDGAIWPFYFARYLERHQGQLGLELVRGALTLVYLTQLFGIPLVMLVLWRRGSALFRPLLLAFSALNAMALILYLAYPAAPPWWVYQNGFGSPSVGHSMPVGLTRDSALGVLFHLNPNRFAAIPSLHGAYPLLLTLILATRRAGSGWVALAAVYAAAMSLACVFLNQHYLIDLVIGGALALLALPFAALEFGRIDGSPREEPRSERQGRRA